jgi:Carboxypeptidase regulatory-like domain
VGGRVYNARRGDDTVFVQPFPTLSGVLRDSVTARPVPNAQLFLRESGRVAVTDSVGAFTIGTVRPGVHTLQINTSSLDSLGAARVKRLPVADSLSASRLAVPSLREALAGMCVRDATFSRSSVPSLIHGVVTARAADSPTQTNTSTVTTASGTTTSGSTTSGSTTSGSTTSASDSQPTFVRAVWMDPYTGMPMRFSTQAEPSGRYRLCGLPPGIPLDLHAERGARSSMPVRVQLNGTSPYGVKHHDVQPRGASEGALHGVVRDGQRRLVSGALVSIDSLLLRSVTEMSGAWRMPRVGAGRVVLSVRRVGFAPLDTAIMLAAGADSTLNLVLTALPRLGAAPRSTDGSAANGSTVDDRAAEAAQLAAFEARRMGPGQFVLRDRLARAEGKPLGDLLRTLRDAAITPAITLSGATPSGDVSSAVLQGVVLRSGATTFRCPSAVFLDSRPLYFGVGDLIDLNLFAPEQFESLEWYANDREVPPVFRGLATCGLLVLHARR